MGGNYGTNGEISSKSILPFPLTNSRGYDDGCVGYMADDSMSVQNYSFTKLNGFSIDRQPLLSQPLDSFQHKLGFYEHPQQHVHRRRRRDKHSTKLC